MANSSASLLLALATGDEKVVVVGGADIGPADEDSVVMLLSLLGLALADPGLQSREEVEVVNAGRVVAGRVGRTAEAGRAEDDAEADILGADGENTSSAWVCFACAEVMLADRACRVDGVVVEAIPVAPALEDFIGDSKA